MPPIRLLVSVRSPAEAEEALAGGADILDVKEPSRGALGCADEHTIQSVVSLAAGRVAVSAALGEMQEARPLPDLHGVTWAKIGLAQCRPADFQTGWRKLADSLKPTRLLGVHYADEMQANSPSFSDVLRLVNQSDPEGHPRGILIDTATKDGRGLLHWLSMEELVELRSHCRHKELFLALAGSLTISDIKLICGEVLPDIIAVRGAACRQHDRLLPIDRQAVRLLKEAIAGGS